MTSEAKRQTAPKRMIFVLAQNPTEAKDLFDHGCGYESRGAAEEARSSPEIDSYYRNLLKVFEFEVIEAGRTR